MEGKEKIRVLRIINRFNLGGPTYNATFLTRFISDDFETLLVGGLPEEDETDSLHIVKDYGLEPVLVKEMQRKPDFKSDRAAYRKLKKIIEDFNPHIVHTHAAKAGALGRRAAVKKKVPIVVHTFHGHVFHSYFGKLKTSAFKYIERRLAKKSTGIIAISNIQKIELAEEHKICHESKIEVIPLGFDLQKFNDNLPEKRVITRTHFKIAEDEIAIAIVGRLVPVKDHNFFLDALKMVAEKSSKKIRVFIVGDGSERQTIQNRLNEFDLFPNVKIEMTSWVKDVAQFNAGMDIICLTSKNEGTPVSLIEAQAGNKPVLTTNVGGVQDIVDNGNTGIIVERGDLNTYANQLLLLVENEKKRQEMSQNGWNFVESKFHYTTLVRNMENYYKRLLKEKKLL